MTVVLVDGISEPEFCPVDGLRPLAGLGVAENPAGVVLGFDDENAGVGDEDMVYLRGASGSWQGDIVEQEMGTVKVPTDGLGEDGFAVVLPMSPPREAGADDEADHQSVKNVKQPGHDRVGLFQRSILRMRPRRMATNEDI